MIASSSSGSARRSVAREFPRPARALSALAWELAWKNRIILPVLLTFLAIGLGLVLAIDHALGEPWWASYARGAGLLTFIASVALGLAPFCLLDSHGSWRMNSVTTRWSVLPVRTLWLVLLPFLQAAVVLTALVWAWSPLLHRLIPIIDMGYVLAVFLTAILATQALAWTLPRKPGQFWPLAGLIFFAALLGAIVPQDPRGWEETRAVALLWLTAIAVGSVFWALWAAGKNRCGDWPGELPSLLPRRLRASSGTSVFRRPAAVLFATEVAPQVRGFIFTWVVVIGVVLAWVFLSVWLHPRGGHINWLWIGLGVVTEGLPNLAVPGLLIWGLFCACEPCMGFQTRLTGYRSTRPLTPAMLAGPRLAALVLIWMSVWLPLLLLNKAIVHFNLLPPDMPALGPQGSPLLQSRMLVTANAMVAALPLLLWGRFEGFPSLFLATLIGWCWTWILRTFSTQDPAPDWLTAALALMVAGKLAAAAWLLLAGLRTRSVGWTFAILVLGGWLALLTGLVCSSLPRESWTANAILPLAVMLPLARLAACPMAMAANRHR
jgi:hypothetical protein